MLYAARSQFSCLFQLGQHNARFGSTSWKFTHASIVARSPHHSSPRRRSMGSSDSKFGPRYEREGDRMQALERVIHGEGMGHETQWAQCLSSLTPLEGGGVPPPLFQIVASRWRVPFGCGAVHSHCATSFPGVARLESLGRLEFRCLRST